MATYHVVWECVVEQWLNVRRMLSNKRLGDPHNCNNKDHSILGCDRGVIWCPYGDFSDVFPLKYLTVYLLILILDPNFNWRVSFIIVTAGLMEVLLDMKLKSNCVSL